MITTALITTLIITVIGGEYENRGQDDKSLVRPRGIFTKEEFLGMVRVVDQERKKKAK